MATWTREDLNNIAAADEIKIAPLNRDGTPRHAVTIWIVRVGDDLYIRSAYGHDSRWFRGAQTQHQGRIFAAAIEKEVVFLDADPELNDEIDDAYRSKYRRHGAQYVNMMVSPAARAATIKLAPR